MLGGECMRVQFLSSSKDHCLKNKSQYNIKFAIFWLLLLLNIQVYNVLGSSYYNKVDI
jgi:hypothetical protein